MLKLLLFLVFMGTYGHVQAAASQPETSSVGEQSAFSKVVDEILRFISSLPIAAGLGDRSRASHFEARGYHGNCDPIVHATCKQHNMVPQGICCTSKNDCTEDYHGVCKISWQNSVKCDYVLDSRCGNNTDCYCCIDCMKDVATACRYGKGKCMKECDVFSYSSPSKCHYANCSCCHTCYSTTCGRDNVSVCLSNEDKCTEGYYTLPDKCEGGNCTCCGSCIVSESCRAAGGYPIRNTSMCRSGFVADETDGHCHCCKPESTDSPVCKLSDEENSKTDARISFCTEGACPANYKTFYSGCATSEKSCVRCVAGGFTPFKHRTNCSENDGYCTKGECKKGYHLYENGCISNDDIPAICCVPECEKYSRR